MTILIRVLLGLTAFVTMSDGIRVLTGDCAAVTFDGSRSIGGRAFLLNTTCLNTEQANAYDVPTGLAGWGLICIALVAISAILWLPLLIARTRSTSDKSHSNGLPTTPLSRDYNAEFMHQVRLYEPQIRQSAEAEGRTLTESIFTDRQVAVMHKVAFKSAVFKVGSQYSGRNAHRKRSAVVEYVSRPDIEWRLLAFAAHKTGRSQDAVWRSLAQIQSDSVTPLTRLVKSGQASYRNPPFAMLVGDQGTVL